MKEASHGVFRVGVGINDKPTTHAQRPGSADSGSSSRQMNQDDAETAFSLWFSEKKHEAYQLH